MRALYLNEKLLSNIHKSVNFDGFQPVFVSDKCYNIFLQNSQFRLEW